MFPPRDFGRGAYQDHHRRRRHPGPHYAGYGPPPNGMYIRPNSWKQSLWAIGVALSAIAVWFGTPINVWITELVLDVAIPVETDVALGREAARQLPYRTVYHPQWTPIVKSVGSDLVQTLQSRNNRHSQVFAYEWDFAVIRADFVNAFALPGGTIRVTSRLLELLQPSDGELAALLGHEMGHVLHRHSQARILQKDLFSYLLRAVLHDDPNDRHPKSFGQSLGSILTRSAAWLGEQRFSRRDEYQADATSWELLVQSGHYNPQSLHSLLYKLQQQEKQHTSIDDPLARKLSEWSRTHPATEDRLVALDKKWKALPVRERRRLSKFPV